MSNLSCPEAAQQGQGCMDELLIFSHEFELKMDDTASSACREMLVGIYEGPSVELWVVVSSGVEI